MKYERHGFGGYAKQVFPRAERFLGALYLGVVVLVVTLYFLGG